MLRVPILVAAVVVLFATFAAPQSPAQLSSQATQAMQAEDYVTAERLFAELSRSIPNVAEVYSNLGLARYYQKKFTTAEIAFNTALRLNPTLFVPNFFLASTFSEDGRYTEALPLAEKAVAAEPEDKVARRLLASIFVGLKRENQAISQYQKLLEHDPHDVESLYDLALIYLDLGESAFQQLPKYKEAGFAELAAAERDAPREGFETAAAEEYRRAIAASPSLSGARVALGDLWLRSGKWSLAGQAFRDELAVDPFSYDGRLGLARVAVHEQKCDAAVRSLDEAVEIRPEFFDPLPNLARDLSAAELRPLSYSLTDSASGELSFGAALLLWSLAEARGQTEQAAQWRTFAEQKRDVLIRSFKAPAESSTGKILGPSEQRAIGMKYLREKRYEEGLGVVAPLVAKSADDTELSLLVSRALFSLRRFTELLEFLDRVRLNSPEAIYLRGMSSRNLALRYINEIVGIDPQSARSHQLLGNAYVSQQMFPEAAREFEIALKIQPNDPELYFALGNACFKYRKFQEAESAYEQALGLNPRHAEAHAMRGYALLELSRPSEAIPQLRLALGLDPHLVSAHALLGRALSESGEVAGAVQQLELAEASDADGTVHYQLANLYRKLGEPEKAKQALLTSEKIRRERRQDMEQNVILAAPNHSQPEKQ